MQKSSFLLFLFNWKLFILITGEFKHIYLNNYIPQGRKQLSPQRKDVFWDGLFLVLKCNPHMCLHIKSNHLIRFLCTSINLVFPNTKENFLCENSLMSGKIDFLGSLILVKMELKINTEIRTDLQSVTVEMLLKWKWKKRAFGKIEGGYWSGHVT